MVVFMARKRGIRSPMSAASDVNQRLFANPCIFAREFADGYGMYVAGYLLSNGNKFDASYDRGKPFSFKVKHAHVLCLCVPVSVYICMYLPVLFAVTNVPVLALHVCVYV